MQRSVTAHLVYWVDSPCTLELQVAVSAEYGNAAVPEVTLDGVPMAVEELVGEVGSRHHLVQVPRGTVDVQYAATIDVPTAPARVEPLDPMIYTRQSRYCESDRLAGFAASEFRGLASATDLLPAVSSWVGDRLEYVPGSSGPTDGAVATLLAQRGVCRDYAHLTVALLRACGVPARVAAVYAPGLWPMDFHAVAEAMRRRRMARRRPLVAGTPVLAGAHRHRPRRRGHGVPDQPRRRDLADPDGGRRRGGGLPPRRRRHRARQHHLVARVRSSWALRAPMARTSRRCRRSADNPV